MCGWERNSGGVLYFFLKIEAIEKKFQDNIKHKPPSFPKFLLAVVYITLYYIYTTIILGILLGSANFI